MRKTVERTIERTESLTDRRQARAKASRVQPLQVAMNQFLKPLLVTIAYPVKGAAFLVLLLVFLIPLGLFQGVVSASPQEYKEL